MPPIPDLFGEPLQIVSNSEDQGFELKEDVLEQVLLDQRIRDKKVCVLSVAGAFRKGKSFLLDFFLRYLMKQVRSWSQHFLKPFKIFSVIFPVCRNSHEC